MNALIRLKKTTPVFVIAFVLAWFALSPTTQAVVPPPDGGYPNFTTAAGDHALQALTLGLGNTGLGTFSLFSVTTGSFNTALGAGSLDLNTADSNTATGAASLLFNTTGTENTARAKDHRGVDLISDALPFGRLWYGEPDAVSNAIGYALHYSRSHNAVIRVYDAGGNVIETHEHAGEFKEW